MSKSLDLTGKVFGRLTVISQAESRRSKSGAAVRMWSCICICKAMLDVRAANLLAGNTRSCGCLERELTTARNKSNATHGLTKTGGYSAYRNMIGRCHCTTNDAYKDYGGRGIFVCDRWREDYRNFQADMGERPTPRHTLDRIDNDGPYIKENCRWVTRREQCFNKRTTRTITHEGKTLCIAE